MINPFDNKLFNFIFALMTTNVYLISESLQLSSLISSSSHNSPTIYTYAYNLFYSWLVVFLVTKISNITVKKFPNILIYYLFYVLGAIGFALLGEVPFLKNFALVPGFWKHLDGNAKLTIIIFSIFIVILGIIQLRQAIRDRDCLKHLFSYFIFFIFYGITLSILLFSHASELNIHVHHAISASFLSFWFIDWNSTSSYIFHAILMGVVVEGIDFYGIAELSLFLCNIGNLISFNYALLISVIFFLLTIPFIVYLNNYKKKYFKLEPIKDENLLGY